MPLAKPEDDFFAFGSNDFDMTPPKKKLKKEKKHHRHHRHHNRTQKQIESPKAGRTVSLRSVSSSSDPLVSDIEPVKAEKMSSLPQGKIEKSASRSKHPVDDDLKKLLGLNNDNDDGVEYPASSYDFRSEPIASYNDDLNQMQTEDESILNQMDSEISEAKKYDDGLWKKRGYKKEITGNFPVELGGQTILAKKAPFEITVSLRYQEREFSVFLKAKGSTSFQKIRETVLKQVFRSNTLWSFTSSPEKLVFFIYDLDIIVNQVLRIGSLLRSSKKKVERSFSDDSFVLRTMLAPMGIALQIQAEEKQKKANSTILQGDPDRNTGKITRVSTSRSTTIESLENIFLVRMKYPDGLRVKLYGTSGEFMGKELSSVREDKSKKAELEVQPDIAEETKESIAEIGKSNFKRPEVIKLDDFSDDEKEATNDEQEVQKTLKDEVVELSKPKYMLVPTTVGFYKLEDQDVVELEYRDSRNEEDDNMDAKGLLDNLNMKNDTYFGIKLVGKDGKVYQVGVKPETSVQSMIEYYRKKANVPERTHISLIFDEEPLDPKWKVSDTELEQDFMVDVVLKYGCVN
ncbi:hypothetical protein HII13_001384 [Brettanomyces bruxellensis]|nr:hypothetical protein HII13_001384 [Brettanomyces bruxellensis]